MADATPFDSTARTVPATHTPRHDALQSGALADVIASSARLILSVLASPDLLLALSPSGYNEVELNKGLSLFTIAQARFDARQEALGVATLAMKARDIARTIVKKEFRAYRTLVQANYHKADRANLGGSGRMPADGSRFLQTARSAYKSALIEPYRSVLSGFGFTPERLNNNLSLLDKLVATEGAYENAENKAQVATAARDAAADALKHWTIKLRAIARDVLKDRPDLASLMKE